MLKVNGLAARCTAGQATDAILHDSTLRPFRGPIHISSPCAASSWTRFEPRRLVQDGFRGKLVPELARLAVLGGAPTESESQSAWAISPRNEGIALGPPGK